MVDLFPESQSCELQTGIVLLGSLQELLILGIDVDVGCVAVRVDPINKRQTHFLGRVVEGVRRGELKITAKVLFQKPTDFWQLVRQESRKRNRPMRGQTAREARVYDEVANVDID